jgi:hypothetical protein
VLVVHVFPGIEFHEVIVEAPVTGDGNCLLGVCIALSDDRGETLVVDQILEGRCPSESAL